MKILESSALLHFFLCENMQPIGPCSYMNKVLCSLSAQTLDVNIDKKVEREIYR